jgi:hypothetical protein
MWSLSALSNYTRDIPDNRRMMTVNNIPDVGLFDALKGSFNNTEFIAGNNVQQLIKSNVPLRAKAHGENIAIPQGGVASYDPLLIPLAELIDVATITKQALDRATGMPGSWGSAVDESIDDMQGFSFKEYLRFCTIGSGLGLMARVKSAAVQSDGTANTYVRVTCDNTYNEFGWDNVQMIQEGMMVEFAHSTGVTYADTSWASCTWPVVAVAFGDRENSGTAVDGTFDVDCGTEAAASTFQAALADNDLVFRYGAVSDGLGSGYPLPRGLFYFLQDGTLLAGQDVGSHSLRANYFGLARSGYRSLRARIVQGATPGTPEDWDMSDVSGEMLRIKKGSGKGEVDVVLVNLDMAACLGRRSDSDHTVQVVTSSTEAASKQTVAVRQIPQFIKTPTGKMAKVVVDEAIPNNSMVMLDSRDLWMHQLGAFDFLKLYGDIWGPTKGDSYTNFEALYGGYLQFSASRCDNMCLMQDMRSDI